MIELLLYPLVFGAGVGTGYGLARRARGATLGPMTSSARDNRRAYIAGTIALVLLILAGVFTAKQVTESAADEAARDRTAQFEAQAACISQWGKEVVETIETRSEATAKLERALAVKDKAYDEVIRIAALRNRTPPEATEIDGDAALEAANEARERVEKVRIEVDDIRDTVEYPAPPTLTCAIKAPVN